MTTPKLAGHTPVDLRPIGKSVQEMVNEYPRLLRERDELREALESVLERFEEHGYDDGVSYDDARTLLDRVKP